MTGTGTSWPWQSYTPTLTNITLGAGTRTCAYVQVGKTVIVRFAITLGAGGSMSSLPNVSLPVTASSSYTSGVAFPIGNIRFLDNAVAGYPGYVWLNTTTTFSFYPGTATGTYVGEAGLSSTVPFAWATGDGLYGTLVYEAA